MSSSRRKPFACLLALLLAGTLLVLWPPTFRSHSSSTSGKSAMPTAATPGNASRQPGAPTAVPDVMQAHNIVEEAKLQDFLTRRNYTVQGVIVILATAQRLPTLLDSLRLLNENFNARFRYPLVIFHEFEFLPVLETVRPRGYVGGDGGDSTIFFQHVTLELPPWHLKKFGPVPGLVCSRGTIGYRHMCRFQAKLLYEQPIMRHFDHYWRLDDDSKIKAPVNFDVFEALTAGGFSYGYYESNIDECAGNLWNVTEQYARARAISPTFYRRLKRNEIFFNNFEVSSLAFWRSRAYREFMDHVDSLGGMYTHRWGDAAIKTLALSLHVPLREIYRYANVSYDHHGIGSSAKTNFLP